MISFSVLMFTILDSRLLEDKVDRSPNDVRLNTGLFLSKLRVEFVACRESVFVLPYFIFPASPRYNFRPQATVARTDGSHCARLLPHPFQSKISP